MIKEIDLRKLVIEIDDELIKEGKEPSKRSFHTNLKIINNLGIHGMDILNNPISNEVNKIYSELYRSTDLCMPPMHTGAFMFRDIFFSIRMPITYGKVINNPIELLDDITENQKEWLFSDKKSGLIFFDQVIDLMDFIYGLDDVRGEKTLPDKTLLYWLKAKQQLEAVSATVLGSFDKDAITQNSCLATELILKGALIIGGVPDNELIHKYGHKLINLANKAIEQLPNIDKEVMLFVVNKFPDYVQDRYNDTGLSRLELGNLLMYAQYVGGEILRQFSKRNFRTEIMSVDSNWNLTNRTFPKA